VQRLERQLDADLAGVLYVSSGLGGMSGAQPKAADIATEVAIKKALDGAEQQIGACVLDNGAPGVDVEEEEAGGLRLMERMTGYDRAVLVDAAVTGGTPGEVRRLTPDDLPTQRTAAAHGIDLPGALALGRQLGYPMPSEVRIVAIEAASVLEFRHDMTPAVAAAVEPAVEAVLEELLSLTVRQRQ